MHIASTPIHAYPTASCSTQTHQPTITFGQTDNELQAQKEALEKRIAQRKENLRKLEDQFSEELAEFTRVWGNRFKRFVTPDVKETFERLLNS